MAGKGVEFGAVGQDSFESESFDVGEGFRATGVPARRRAARILHGQQSQGQDWARVGAERSGETVSDAA